MSGTLLDTPPSVETTSESHADHGPDVSALQDHMPMHLRAPRVLAGMTLTIGLVFLISCFRPLWHTDLWGHLSYGRVIWQTGSLPATEPLLPFAQGMKFVDSAWLTQLIGLGAFNAAGPAGLQGLYALSIALCSGLLAWSVYRTTKNGWFALWAILAFLFVPQGHLNVIRPQLAGLVCFVTLLTVCTSRKLHRSDWWVIPALFAAWANLHGSFMMGLTLLGCFVLGRAADVFRKTGSLGSVMTDNRTRRLFMLFELAAVSVLLNPYGIGLYLEALHFSSNPNLRDLTEWSALSLRDSQGQAFAILSLLLAILYRSSPRRVRGWEVISLAVFGGAAAWSNRLIVWWAPIAALLMATHGYAIWRAWRHLPLVPEKAPRAGKWTVVTAGLIWIFFAYSPIGAKVLHGIDRGLERSVDGFTPMAAAKYLTKNPPEGMVLNLYEWGDFLQWNCPTGTKLFVNSHAHLMPREVWQAYMQIIEMRSGWEDALDRYGVNTIVIDKENRDALIKKLKEDDKWKVAFEQDGQVIFLRKQGHRQVPLDWGT